MKAIIIDDEKRDNIGTDRTALNETPTTIELFKAIEVLIKAYGNLYDDDRRNRDNQAMEDFKTDELYLDIKKGIETISSEEIRNELKEDAVNSVKATFIIDSLAKAENIQVTDQEVMQVLYYEAMQMGQNPQEVVKQYQEAGYLPAIKMSMIEEKVISKLLDEKLGK